MHIFDELIDSPKTSYEASITSLHLPNEKSEVRRCEYRWSWF